MIGKLDDIDAPGPRNWLVNPRAARVLRATLKSAQGDAFLMEGAQIGDIPATSAGQIPNIPATATTPERGTAILGAFSEVLLGIWSEIDLLVNPFAEAPYRRGNVLIRAMSTVDVGVRHPAAFVVAQDVPLPV